MEKRKVKPKDIVRDIRAGVEDATLMTRYALSAQALQSVFTKLVQAGMISQSELDDRVPIAERTVDIGLYICPACGNIQGKEFTECPRCGFTMPGFLKKTKEPEPRDESAKAPPSAKSQVISLRTDKKPAAALPQMPARPSGDAATSASNLERIARYCRILGVATVVCYVLFLGAVFAFTQMALPPGVVGFNQAILAVCVLSVPVAVTALVVLVALRALSEALKVFARLTRPR
jgi:hypothetical protein